MAETKNDAVQPNFSSLYLVAYNILCFCLWTHTSIQLWIFLCTGSKASVWEGIRFPLMLAQSLAILEIIHAGIGLVRSSPMTVALQVLSRLHIIFWIWRFAPIASSSSALVLTVSAWSAAEIIRYPFYALSAVNSKNGPPYWLKWCRYTAFIVLYPLGIFGEVRSIILALPVLYSNPLLRAYPFPMPNFLNFQMDLYATYLFLLLCYIPGSYHMYFHMLRQRSRALKRSAEPHAHTD